MDNPTKYYSHADTNKLIRAALKEAFPGIRFSVRATGGGSTNIDYIDGPGLRSVEEVANQFRGASFDGMIDLESPVYAVENGQRVHYGSRYIFVHRDFSEDILRDAKAICEKEGVDFASGSYQMFPNRIRNMEGDSFATYMDGPAYSIQMHVAAELANGLYALANA